VADQAETDAGMADPAVRSYALLQIQAEVLNAAFGQEARHRVLTQGDQQIQDALKQFAAAQDLLADRERKAAEGQLGRLNQSPAGEGQGRQRLATPGTSPDNG